MALVPASDSAWNDQFAKLKEFKAEHGHCNVLRSNDTLGSWVTHQREEYRNGKLRPDHIKLLEAVGFHWDAMEANWELRLQQLVEFKEKRGHCKVPKNEKVLENWVWWQRDLYRKKKLRQDRIKTLEDIGFSWDHPVLVTPWEDRFQQLVQFREKNGHCKGPYNNKELGKWVGHQRAAYKKKKMRQDHIKMLEGIGFSWDPLVTPWDDWFQQIAKFKGENGHCKVPQKHGELGRWVRNQRQMYKNGKLSQERIDRLEGIGFVWDVRMPFGGKSLCGESVNDSIWNDWYAKLQQYKAEHGHCGVPLKHEKLGRWVSRQRKAYMDGNMNPRHVEMLDEVGFCWEAKDAAWEVRFQRLVAFKEKSGHCRVTRRYNHQLWEWARCQRELYKNKKLRVDHIGMLEDIGFSWNPSDERWDDQFQQLVEFKGENGHCNVPIKHEELGHWVRSQRTMYKTGKLSTGRINRLEGIGFVWDGTKSWDEKWDARFQQLVEFKEGNGHCNVPQTPEELGRWVRSQRDMYKTGRLSKERINRLEGIGFVWGGAKTQMGNSLDVNEGVQKKGTVEELDVSMAQSESLGDRKALLPSVDQGKGLQIWDDRFQLLVKFKGENGHCKVPIKHEELGRWVRSQREKYKTRKLSQDRIDRLKGIGFVWDGTKTQMGNSLDVNEGVQKKGTVEEPAVSMAHQGKGFQIWDYRFQLLVEFKGENGHCKVPIKHEELGRWVSSQREKYKAGKLSQDRIDRLELIGFVWDARINK